MNTVDGKTHILKARVSEKKAKVDILMLNSQGSCPFTPDGRLSSEQGFILARGAPVGKPTALVRGTLQLCTPGERAFWKPLTKVGWRSKAKHTVLT